MLTLFFWLASAVITTLLYFAFPSLHLAWILPLLIGFFLAFCLLFVVYLEISSFFLPKDPPKEKPRPYAFHTIRLALPWFIALLGTRIRVKGREKLPPEPTVLVCNHRSAFDPVFLICGDSDKVVPYEENGAHLARMYRESDVPFEEILKPGCDHHPHGIEDLTPLVAFAEKYCE